MNREVYLDDYDEDELPAGLRAQLERLEAGSSHRLSRMQARQQRKLKVRRDIEDYSELRRMRADIDYLN
jgi:hypothetical protein